MGVRGLTTFINNRSHLYLEAHQLHDCNLIIDGNSMASNLYKWHCKSNDCFGGDYDKFARVIETFFQLLSECNIVPYVIFDGGYERRKIATVISRMKNKIRAADALNSVTDSSGSVFPLFLREVFVDIALGLNLKVARCEFEGDMEIAYIAKILNCPVLSYDSDFYIFGSLYVPFSTVELTVRKGKDKTTKKSFNFLSCKIYKVESFLTAFGGLHIDNLPILGVLLGNDYVKGSLFAPFFRNLKIQKCHGGQSDQQKRIKSVIVWLQNETINSAIKTVLGRFKDRKRKIILRKIEGAMKGYFNINSDLLKYLDIDASDNKIVEVNINYMELEKNPDESNESKSDENCDTEDESCTDQEEVTSEDESFFFNENYAESLENQGGNLINENCKTSITDKIFHRNFRKCLYPACFMDMRMQNKYYCVPQIEDSTVEHSHFISLELLSIIHKILTGSAKDLSIVARSGKFGVNNYHADKCDLTLPTIKDIENMRVNDKKTVLFSVLKIDKEFIDVIDLFPIEWHLFLVSLKYSLSKSSFDVSLIYSLILCFIILNYVDAKLGFYRSVRSILKKFDSVLQQNKQNIDKAELSIVSNKTNARKNYCVNLSLKDCVIFMEKIVGYFQMDFKLISNYRLYDKSLVHSMSQMQSIFLHVKHLNSLLDNPFPYFLVHKAFNGTFVYNMTKNFRKRTNLRDYIELFLKDCPSIFDSFTNSLNLVENKLNLDASVPQGAKKHRKRRRKKKEDNNEVEEIFSEKEDDAVLDPNNPYSLLSFI